MNVIETFDLCKYYQNTRALENINMTLQKGDIYGLIGKNGAGKTTLMRILCGLSCPSEGSYSLFGLRTEKEIIESRKKISAIIEAPALYKNFNARMNLQAIALLKGIDKNTPEIDKILKMTGLSGTGNKKVKFFSMGMKQRLGLAMALLSQPEILILDEPVNGLDPEGIVEIREILKKLNAEKGVTILISSHILSELSHLATRYGIIDKGRLIEEISASGLESKMKKTLNVVLALKEDMTRAGAILNEKFGIADYKVEGDTLLISGAASDKASEINMAFARENIMIKGISSMTMDLEQYFLESTRRAAK
jgi:ABC-2 type transport system ATP-binding protein